MDRRRRRANNFIDSLLSFRQIDGEDSQTASQIYSEDSLDTNSIRNKHVCAKNNERRGGSIILAGKLANEESSSSSSLYHTAEESCNSVHSDIKSSLKDTFDTSYDKTSYLGIPDLNKRINLFHNEHLKKKFDSHEKCLGISSALCENKDKENIDPCRTAKSETSEVQHDIISAYPRAISSSSLRHIVMPNEGIRRSKSCTTLYEKLRDTNYNIKATPFFLAPIEATAKVDSQKIEPIVSSFNALSLSEPSTSLNKVDNPYSTEENQKSSSVEISESSENTKSEFNPTELRTFLHSLANQESSEPSKATPTREHLLRRLSATFYDSPRNFTERLLTIIEESVVDNDCSIPMDFPEVSLCRLTAELRKMCKFIENETEPEWPSSLGLSMSPCIRDETRKPASEPSRKSSDVRAQNLSPSKKLYLVTSPATPIYNIKSPKKMYRCTPKDASQGTPLVHSTNTPTHDSTSVFESLEAYCKSLYPDEYETLSTEEDQLQSSSQNVSSIFHAYNNQMASLENSPNIHEQLRNVVKTPITTSGSMSQRDIVSETPCYRLLAYEKCDKIRKKSISPHLRRSRSYEMIEPDELENTLMYEIAKKRQRCLDTARMMMEIDATSDMAKIQETGDSDIVTETVSSISDDAKLMETLMSCKKYQDYLEEHKPLLNLIQRTELCRSRSLCSRKEKGTLPIHFKESNKAEIATPRSLVTAKGSKNSSSAKYLASKNAITVSKPKLFITPGKTPTSKRTYKEKRTYFPNLMANPNKQKETGISPHAKSIYRQMGLNYDSVISPVGMYIRGTDPHLMKNLRPKTDEMLLTPIKTQTPSSAVKPGMRFKLSPKQTKEPPTTVEERNNKFLHPKVLYKLPSHIRTIKQTENRKVGNRVNNLLRSTQDKVVIRHEGRTKTVQKDYLDQPEIHYDSTEESVHIEQTARKTCCSHVQKN